MVIQACLLRQQLQACYEQREDDPGFAVESN